MTKTSKTSKTASAKVATVATVAVPAPAPAPVAVPAPAPAAPVAVIVHEAALAAAKASQASGAGPFAIVWSYLGQLPPDALATVAGAKAVRAELKGLGINPTTVTCQVGRFVSAGGNRKVATAFGRTKALGQAALAKLAASAAPAGAEG